MEAADQQHMREGRRVGGHDVTDALTGGDGEVHRDRNTDDHRTCHRCHPQRHKRKGARGALRGGGSDDAKPRQAVEHPGSGGSKRRRPGRYRRHHATARAGGRRRHHDVTAPWEVSMATTTTKGMPPRKRSETGMTFMADAMAADGVSSSAAVAANIVVRRTTTPAPGRGTSGGQASSTRLPSSAPRQATITATSAANATQEEW